MNISFVGEPLGWYHVNGSKQSLLDGDQGDEDPASEHCQHPSEVKRNLPQPDWRQDSPEQFDRWIGQCIDQFHQYQPEPTRPKPGVEHHNPVENESRPQDIGVDTKQPLQREQNDCECDRHRGLR